MALAAMTDRATAEGSEPAAGFAIAADFDAHFTDLDAYQKRMHTANILRAVKDMRAQ